MTDRIYCEFCQAYFEGIGYREHRREDVAIGITKKPRVVNHIPVRSKNLK
jgi:hypothetical protein